jgi:predicted DNA repair protein MutK
MATAFFVAIALYGFFSVHTKFDEQGLIKKQEKEKTHRR